MTQPPPTPKAIVTDAIARLEIAISERLEMTGGDAARVGVLIDDIRTVIAAANPEAREIMRWRPIETAPKDGSSILAIWRWGDNPDNGAETHMVVRWCGWWDAQGFTQPEPTHWMPLPPAPEGTTK
jgi:hypothetical protein